MIIFVITTCSITTFAVINVNKTYYCVVSSAEQTGVTMPQINAFPVTLSGTTDYSTLFIGWQVDQIIPDNTIVVAQMVISNIRDNSTTPFQVGAGQLASKSVTESHNGSFYLNMPYDQEILETTIARVSDGVRITIAYKASGYTSKYPFIRFYPLIKQDMGYVVQATSIDLYESIEDAAGSGVTPEEMREVLSSWGEEELIPGIGQAVGDKIEEVVPDAILDGMDEHDNQLKTEGGSVIENIKEQIGETITPYFENTDQIRDAIHGGASGVFGYAGTDAVITLPAARNPLTGNSLMWNEYQIDLGMYYNRLPAVLRQLISALLTMLVSIGVIRELLDTVNTILIHREILGMPDDYLKSWTRKDG